MLRLPHHLREKLKKPLGPVKRGEELEKEVGKQGLVATVGDVVTSFFTSHGRTPDISIIDGKTQRDGKIPTPDIPSTGSWDIIIEVKNPPGTLTSETMEVIKKAAELLPQKTLIIIDGEEDLTALVVVSLLPDGTRVIYGLPYEGAVVLTVNEDTKNICRKILSQMEAEANGDRNNRKEG